MVGLFFWPDRRARPRSRNSSWRPRTYASAVAALLDGAAHACDTLRTGPATTIANMRALRVRAIDMTCACGRRTILDVWDLPDAIEVPSPRRRLRCASCGARPVDVRPEDSRGRMSTILSCSGAEVERGAIIAVELDRIEGAAKVGAPHGGDKGQGCVYFEFGPMTLWGSQNE